MEVRIAVGRDGEGVPEGEGEGVVGDLDVMVVDEEWDDEVEGFIEIELGEFVEELASFEGELAVNVDGLDTSADEELDAIVVERGLLDMLELTEEVEVELASGCVELDAIVVER